MIAAGTGPDIWFDANRTTGPLTRKGVTTDLEPFLEADPNFNEDDYIDNCWIAQTYDGRPLGSALGQRRHDAWSSTRIILTPPASTIRIRRRG